MADISFYKYLETAFRHKLFKDKTATSFNFLGYNLPYETIGAKKGIFEYARRVLPKFYTGEFPDTAEGNLQMAKKVLEKLDRREDIELEKYFDPATAPTEYQQLVAEAQAQSQQIQTQQATGASATFSGGMGLSSAPSISSGSPAPRIIHNVPRDVPHAPETPKPDIIIANKSGVVTGEHSVKPSSASRRFNFRPSAAFTNTLRNFGSRTQVFFQRNVGKYLTAGRIGTAVSAGIGAIAGAGLGPLGVVTGGGLGALAPSWIRSGGGARFFGRVANGAINAGVGISNQISRGSLIKGPPKKVWIGLLVGLFAISLGAGIIPLPGEQQSQAQAGPTPSYKGGGAGILSCPLNNGKISCGSQSSGGSCNHCSLGYEPHTCPVGANTGRETAVDVVSSDKSVFFPLVGGANVQWIVDEVGTPIPTSEGGGTAVAATTKVSEKSYRIRLVHITSTNLTQGQQVASGTLVGQYGPDTSHVHITVQENEEFKPADLYFNLCGK